MATLSFIREQNGDLTLSGYMLQPGDQINLTNTGEDAVLTVSDAEVFGATKYEIATNETLDLIVQDKGTERRFDWAISDADDTDRVRGEGGSGTVAGRRGG